MMIDMPGMPGMRGMGGMGMCGHSWPVTLEVMAHSQGVR